MDTREFFQAILPRQGYICLAEFQPDKKPKHTFYEEHDAAAMAARTLDAAGKTVYHACATFKTPENRKAENAGWMRSFWLDADVEEGNPEKYPNLKEALTDVGRVCRELKLPLPLLVRSGMGAHAYWILNDDLDASGWQRTALRLKHTLEHLRFRQDRTRTADASSVLRPVGTHWRKAAAREVQALSPGVAVSHEQFAAALESYCTQHELQPSPRADFAVGDDDLTGGATRNYAPSSALRVVQFCATVAHVADKRGDVEEPLWRGMLGLVKHTVEGDTLAHDWSKGYAGYNAKETQEKLERWTAGPTTCAHFRGTNGNRCAGCPQKVSSPIHLGYSADAPPTSPIPGAGDGASGGGEPEPGANSPTWPKGFGWNGSLCYLHKNEDGSGSWAPFCDTLWFPVKRVRGEDGLWYLRVRHQAKNHQWREFDLPCELIGAQHGLLAYMAAHEVFIHGKSGPMQAKELLRHYTLSLQQQNIEQTTYSKLGWGDDFKSFVIGNRRVMAEGEAQVLAGDQVKKAGWDKDFGCAGSLETWVKLIDTLYNRPGAEPYQFTIGCSLAAPLIEITEASNWHGIPVALTGGTGLGKTTTCKVATSIYGHCTNFMIASGRDGATMNAMVSRVGTARNLPLVFDELTDRDSDEVSSFLYMLSSGRPKDRNRADGTIIDLGLNWNTISFITSNKNVTELLFLLDEQAVTEATQIRVFEIALSRDDIEIWSNTNAVELIEHQLLEANYGHAGRAWLRYVIENRGKLKEEIRKLRTRYSPNSAEDTRERYYRDLIAAVVVALKHAAKLGLVKFDLVEVAKWANGNIRGLRRRRAAQSFTPEEYISSFLHSLHGKTIVTKQLRDGRQTSEMPLELIRGEPLARIAIDDQRFLVLRKALTDWCAEHRILASWLIEEMDKRELIVYHNAAQTIKERIGRGTNIPSTPSTCYELRFEKLVGDLVTVGKQPEKLTT